MALPTNPRVLSTVLAIETFVAALLGIVAIAMMLVHVARTLDGEPGRVSTEGIVVFGAMIGVVCFGALAWLTRSRIGTSDRELRMLLIHMSLVLAVVWMLTLSALSRATPIGVLVLITIGHAFGCVLVFNRNPGFVPPPGRCITPEARFTGTTISIIAAIAGSISTWIASVLFGLADPGSGWPAEVTTLAWLVLAFPGLVAVAGFIVGVRGDARLGRVLTIAGGLGIGVHGLIWQGLFAPIAIAAWSAAGIVAFCGASIQEPDPSG